MFKAQGKYILAVESFKNGLGVLDISIDDFYEQYIEQSYSLINLYLKMAKKEEAKNLLDITNNIRSDKGKTNITLDTLPEEIYEECSSSNI